MFVNRSVPLNQPFKRAVCDGKDFVVDRCECEETTSSPTTSYLYSSSTYATSTTTTTVHSDNCSFDKLGDNVVVNSHVK
jgi:hypothetical protein